MKRISVNRIALLLWFAIFIGCITYTAITVVSFFYRELSNGHISEPTNHPGRTHSDGGRGRGVNVLQVDLRDDDYGRGEQQLWVYRRQARDAAARGDALAEATAFRAYGFAVTVFCDKLWLRADVRGSIADASASRCSTDAGSQPVRGGSDPG